MYGLLDRDIVYIKKALEHFEEIEKAVVFGSRAMGNYKKGSDVDIAIFGERVNNKVIFELNGNKEVFKIKNVAYQKASVQ